MGKRQRRVKSSILEIKLDNGKYAYGQDLYDGILFFDIYLDTPLKDLNVLNDKEPLFILAVYNDVITQGVWEKIGKLPIKEQYEVLPFKFMQDELTPGFFKLYNPNTGKATRATREECEGLECAAVWEAEHVESRIKDHYAGKPNVWVEQLKIK